MGTLMCLRLFRSPTRENFLNDRGATCMRMALLILKASIANDRKTGKFVLRKSSKSVDTGASIGVPTFPKNLCGMLHVATAIVSYGKEINVMNGIKKIHKIVNEFITVFHIIKCYCYHCLCDKMNVVLNKRFISRRMYEYVSLKNAMFNMHALCGRAGIGSSGSACTGTL